MKQNRCGGTCFEPRKLREYAEAPTRPVHRRQKARLGPAQAAVATAHMIAGVVYRMLEYQVEYEPLIIQEYERHYRE